MSHPKSAEGQASEKETTDEMQKDNPLSKELDLAVQGAYDILKRAHTPRDDLQERLMKLPSEFPEPSPFGSWRLWWSAPVAGFAALMLLVFFRPARQTRLIPKGSAWQALYAHQNGADKKLQTKELRDGDILFPGDFLQFTYQLSEPQYVMIVGVNQKGELYKLFPPKEKIAKRLHAGKGALPREHGKDGSFRLDDYVGQERFFVLTSLRPFDLRSVRQSFQASWLTHKRNFRKFERLKGSWKSVAYLILKRRHRR